MMTYCYACCTLAIDNMNSADSERREEKRQRINEGGREARVRETAEERDRQVYLGGDNRTEPGGS